MLAIIDISALSPPFMNAVTRIHHACLPVAQLMCFGGFLFLIAAALRERAMSEIWRGMTTIMVVVLLAGNAGEIGSWIESIVLGIEQDSGVGNQTAFADYLDQIKLKFGVDLSALNNAMPQGPANGPRSSGNGTMLTHYAYPGDSTPDSNSSRGIGAYPPYDQPGSLVPLQSAALTDAAAAQYGVHPGQSFTINANSQTYNLVYADHAPESDMRVDIYDPNNSLGGGNNFSANVDSFNNGPLPGTPGTTGNIVSDTFNALIHPAEAAQSALFGVAVYFVSLFAVAAWWVMSLLQSVLFYTEIALSPLFLGALLIRGWENIAKVFIASFIAICLWPFAFLITGLVTKLILSIALNSGNNIGVGAANAAGLSYFWLIALVLVVVTGSVVGPVWLSKQIMSGATGMVSLLSGSGRAASHVASYAGRAASGGISSAIGGSNGGGQRQSMATRPKFSRYMGKSADND